MDELIDCVINQIQEDIGLGDLTALQELLRAAPKEALIGFLSQGMDEPNPELLARFRAL